VALTHPGTRKTLAAYGLLVPVLLLLTLIILIPSLWAAAMSLTNYRLGQALRYVGFDNYRFIFSDPQFWRSAVVTLKFVVASVALQMLLGLGISLLLAAQFFGQRLWIALTLVPVAVTPSVSGTMWRYLLDFNIGPINYFVHQLGFERQMWLASETLALWVVVLVYVWESIPYVFLFLYPARITFPKSMYEAARIDGASPFQCFRFVTMPQLKPIFLVAMVFRTIFAFRTFGIVWNLTEGGPIGATEILAIYLYRQGFKYWRFGSAAAVAILLLAFTVVISGYQIRTLQRNVFVSEKRK